MKVAKLAGVLQAITEAGFGSLEIVMETEDASIGPVDKVVFDINSSSEVKLVGSS